MESENFLKQNFDQIDDSGSEESEDFLINFIKESLSPRENSIDEQLIGLDPDRPSAILPDFDFPLSLLGKDPDQGDEDEDEENDDEDDDEEEEEEEEEEPEDRKPDIDSLIIDQENNVDIASLKHLVKYVNQNGKLTKSWECSTCGRTFQHHYTLLRHLPIHSDVRNFSCTECGKAFRQLSTLTQHLAIHSVDRPYACDLCKKSFNRVSTLISHKKTHSTVKPFQCHLCHKSFHQKGNLRNHIYIHTNERPYRCPHCSKGFNQMSNLVCHKQKAHSDEASSVWPCHRCDKTYPKRSQLRNHEFEYHQIQRTIKHSVKKSMETPKASALQTGIFIPAIQTYAMKVVEAKKETAFAVLHFLKGPPLLVRVIPYSNQSLLRPATNADFDGLKRNAENVSVPVVAAVHQTITANGQIEFKVFQPSNIYKFSSNNQLILQYEDKGPEDLANGKIDIKPSSIQVQSVKTIVQKKPVTKRSGHSLPDLSIIPNKAVKVEPIPSCSNSSLFGEDVSEEEMKRIFRNITEGEPLRPVVYEQSTNAILNPELIDENGNNINDSFRNFIDIIRNEGLDPDYEKIKELFVENGIM